jgi:hypothetical protein
MLGESEYWPICPGCVTSELLSPYAPIGAKALLEAYQSGLMSQSELCTSILEGQIPPPDDAQLRIYVKTLNLVNRDLDFLDELGRLSTADNLSLWRFLAPIILDSPISSQQQMRNIDALYHVVGRPDELHPFTLFAEGMTDGRDHSAQAMTDARTFLRTLRPISTRGQLN